jgi:hypothetical protein
MVQAVLLGSNRGKVPAACPSLGRPLDLSRVRHLHRRHSAGKKARFRKCGLDDELTSLPLQMAGISSRCDQEIPDHAESKWACMGLEALPYARIPHIPRVLASGTPTICVSMSYPCPPQAERAARRTGEKGTIAAPSTLTREQCSQCSSSRIATTLNWLPNQFQWSKGNSVPNGYK